MARGTTHLLPLVLLALLTSGSWAQQPQLWTLEGETVSVRCPYPSQEGLKVKVWCRKTSANTCIILATHSGLSTVPRNPHLFITDNPELGYFTVTMAALRMRDSGTYWCAIREHPMVIVFKTISLVVSQAPTLHVTRSTRSTRSTRTTAWTSTISPVIDRPPSGHWNVISSVLVAFLLLLGLSLLLILYLRKTRGRARAGEDKPHHISDIPTNKDNTVRRTNPAPSQRDSRLSWGSSRQMGSVEDTGDVHYASLTHLKPCCPEESIYVNTHPSPKPTPDPFLAVEYASITKN